MKDWRTGFGLIGTLVAIVLGFWAGAGTQDNVNVLPPPVAQERPASLAPTLKVSDICLDPNAVVQHIIGGFVPRTEVTLKTQNQQGNTIQYTVTVADGQDPRTAQSAIDRSVDGLADPKGDTAPVDDELRNCLTQRAVQKQEGGTK